MQLGAGREPAPERDVVIGLGAQPVSHLLPSGQELAGTDVGTARRGLT